MPDKPVNSASAVRGRRILVVDDNRDAANSLAALLRFVGHEAQTAYDGAQAVENAAAYNPDAVLLDIELPKLNGYDVCREIRRKLTHRNPVIVALTGWGQNQDRQRSHEAGFDGHVVKPTNFDQLIKLLDSLWAMSPEAAPPSSSREDETRRSHFL